jgi:hypothetical protein
MITIDDPRLATGGGGRISITYSPAAAAMMRVMAARLRIDLPETSRRALGLLHFWMSLPPDRHLAIVHDDGSVERLVLERGDGVRVRPPEVEPRRRWFRR